MFTTKDREKCELLYDRYYSGRKFCRTLYRDLVHKNLSPGIRLLDAGCGRHFEFSSQLPGDLEIFGIDMDAPETGNRRSPYGVRGDLENLPFPPGYFDLAISRDVVEHLKDPGKVFREFYRVLKPGGRIILCTPNRWDYVSLIASATPHSFHRRLVSRLFQKSEDDVFPTLYRANSLGKLAGTLRAAGFVKRELEAVNHYPAYLMFSPVLFRLGVLYERLTSLPSLRCLRGTLLGVFEKPDETSHPEAGAAAGRKRAERAGFSSVGV